MPVDKFIHKAMVIGSGPIVIGQSAEFDYSGTQACYALKELGIDVVLVNSNPATIQTDPDMGWKVYLEPLNTRYIIPILEKEKPDVILPTMGGQTGLNLSMELYRLGILNEMRVRIIGSPPDVIETCEDRERFKRAMIEIGEPIAMSMTVCSVAEALSFSKNLQFPLIVRPAYTLGGTGGGIAYNKEELKEIVTNGLMSSAIGEVLIEQSLLGWKEIEYEVMRDKDGNSVIVCAMENIDPMGIHTGDSIVVSPVQTLNDYMYQKLRDASIKIINHLQIEGGCNIQFAVKDDRYVVVEVNPRVSRSSALASKVTGYPIARISAQIAVGLLLSEIPNSIVDGISAFFEPTLDYVVVKIPCWPFDKFLLNSREIGIQMKATGETMAIGGNFKEALWKAVQSAELPKFIENDIDEDMISIPTDKRLFYVIEAINRNFPLSKISNLSGIDRFFLGKLKEVIEIKGKMTLDKEKIELAKKVGLSDKEIGKTLNMSELQIREYRKKEKILPVYNMVDTCAAEFDAKTPYFYSTYNSQMNEATKLKGKSVVVIGSGPIRIGQGIEFDYCCVQAVKALKEEGINAIMVNNNPETVSTDFDISDRLYFEPLTFEHVMNVIENEHPEGVIAQFGGQTAVNLAVPLSRMGVKILGTSPQSIEAAEDREKFAKLLKKLGIQQAQWKTAITKQQIREACREIGYPLLIRPSFVIGGSGIKLIRSEEELLFYLNDRELKISQDYPVLIDKFLDNAIEIDVDAVSDGEDVFIGGIMEHVEEAGIHSGDSCCVLPPQTLPQSIIDKLIDYTKRLARALSVVGVVNIQYVLKDGILYAIEVNPRASRTIPFVSKSIGISMTKLATKCILGHKLKDIGITGYHPPADRVTVKEPVFSFEKFSDADTVLRPEMQSTGEVIGIGCSFPEAFYKAKVAAGNRFPLKGNVLLSVKDKDKPSIVPIAKGFKKLGFRIIATEGTASHLKQHGIEDVHVVGKVSKGDRSILEMIERGEIHLIINTPGNKGYRDGYVIRRAALKHRLPCITTLRAAEVAVKALEGLSSSVLANPVHP